MEDILSCADEFKVVVPPVGDVPIPAPRPSRAKKVWTRKIQQEEDSKEQIANPATAPNTVKVIKIVKTLERKTNTKKAPAKSGDDAATANLEAFTSKPASAETKPPKKAQSVKEPKTPKESKTPRAPKEPKTTRVPKVPVKTVTPESSTALMIAKCDEAISARNEMIVLKNEMRNMLAEFGQAVYTRTHNDIIGYINTNLVPTLQNAFEYLEQNNPDATALITDYRQSVHNETAASSAEVAKAAANQEPGVLSQHVQMYFKENTTGI